MSNLTNADLIDGLMENVKTLGAKAAASDHQVPAEMYASAAKSLAEAIAWLTSPGQAHGGSVSVMSG